MLFLLFCACVCVCFGRRSSMWLASQWALVWHRPVIHSYLRYNQSRAHFVHPKEKKSNPSLFCVSFCGLCFSILFQFDTCAPVSDLCFCFRVDLRERKPKSCGSHSPEGCFDSAPGLPPLLGCPHQHRAHPTRRQTESRGVTVSAQPLMSLIHNSVLTSLYSWIKEGFTAYESNF